MGDSCAELSLGTTAYPNLIAAEGVAITAGRSMLLTCQSGLWKRANSGNVPTLTYRREDATTNDDIGWHHMCSAGMQNIDSDASGNAGYVYITAGPDAQGRYRWSTYARDGKYWVCCWTF